MKPFRPENVLSPSEQFRLKQEKIYGTDCFDVDSPNYFENSKKFKRLYASDQNSLKLDAVRFMTGEDFKKYMRKKYGAHWYDSEHEDFFTNAYNHPLNELQLIELTRGLNYPECDPIEKFKSNPTKPTWKTKDPNNKGQYLTTPFSEKEQWLLKRDPSLTWSEDVARKRKQVEEELLFQQALRESDFQTSEEEARNNPSKKYTQKLLNAHETLREYLLNKLANDYKTFKKYAEKAMEDENSRLLEQELNGLLYIQPRIPLDVAGGKQAEVMLELILRSLELEKELENANPHQIPKIQHELEEIKKEMEKMKDKKIQTEFDKHDRNQRRKFEPTPGELEYWYKRAEQGLPIWSKFQAAYETHKSRRANEKTERERIAKEAEEHKKILAQKTKDAIERKHQQEKKDYDEAVRLNLIETTSKGKKPSGKVQMLGQEEISKLLTEGQKGKKKKQPETIPKAVSPPALTSHPEFDFTSLIGQISNRNNSPVSDNQQPIPKPKETKKIKTKAEEKTTRRKGNDKAINRLTEARFNQIVREVKYDPHSEHIDGINFYDPKRPNEAPYFFEVSDYNAVKRQVAQSIDNITFPSYAYKVYAKRQQIVKILRQMRVKTEEKEMEDKKNKYFQDHAHLLDSSNENSPASSPTNSINSKFLDQLQVEIANAGGFTKINTKTREKYNKKMETLSEQDKKRYRDKINGIIKQLKKSEGKDAHEWMFKRKHHHSEQNLHFLPKNTSKESEHAFEHAVTMGGTIKVTIKSDPDAYKYIQSLNRGDKKSFSARVKRAVEKQNPGSKPQKSLGRAAPKDQSDVAVRAFNYAVQAGGIENVTKENNKEAYDYIQSLPNTHGNTQRTNFKARILRGIKAAKAMGEVMSSPDVSETEETKKPSPKRKHDSSSESDSDKKPKKPKSPPRKKQDNQSPKPPSISVSQRSRRSTPKDDQYDFFSVTDDISEIARILASNIGKMYKVTKYQVLAILRGGIDRLNADERAMMEYHMPKVGSNYKQWFYEFIDNWINNPPNSPKEAVEVIKNKLEIAKRERDGK